MEVETSIVIRTLNEDRHLERLMRCIQKQTYTAWEIVLVDSGSTDATLDIAQRYTSNIYHIAREEFTFGRSLNLGCQHAHGQYLVFCSAHTYPMNNMWLSNLIRPFEDPAIAMVYGRQRGVTSSRVSEERDLERLFGVTSKILIDEPLGNNANAAIRQALWLEQPFDETLTGLEDLDWARKIQRRGYRVYYAADAALYHIHEESLRQVYRRFFREGVAHRSIFPGYRFDRLDFVKGIAYNITADCLYAMRRGKPVSKLLQIPATRIAEYVGRWGGLYYHKKLSRELLLKLYYPKSSESVVSKAPREPDSQETEVPQVEPGEVLVQVAYVGVGATDLEAWRENFEYDQNGHARYPHVPGHEYSGVVVATGAGVRGFRRGDKVVGNWVIGCGACSSCAVGRISCCTQRQEVEVININGGPARYLKLPARCVHKLPREVLLKEAVLIEPLAVCLKGLRKLGHCDGVTACVVGAGPMGNLCAQILKHRGAEVTAVDHDQRKLRLLYKYDINVRPDIEWLDHFDYLIDATGNEEVIPHLVEKSKPAAKILLLGRPYALPIQVCFSTVLCSEKEIYGSTASEPRDWEEAIRLMRNHTINLDDHTATIISLESSETTWKAVQERACLLVLLASNTVLDRI